MITQHSVSAARPLHTHDTCIEIPAKDQKQDATHLGDLHTHYMGIESTLKKRVSLK